MLRNGSARQMMVTVVAQPYMALGDAIVHHTALVGGLPEHLDCINADTPAQLYDVILGEGVWINGYVTVDKGTKGPTVIGKNTVLLAKSHVGHDAVIGADCVLTTGCIIGGHATLGDGVKVGLGAVILPWRKVGDGATVGAGAVVTKDVQAGMTVVGNPARVLADDERNPMPHTER
jgi:acyl-[acyl carrier protein]--UDP-N-acetylglucosamine O-acyltransferase